MATGHHCITVILKCVQDSRGWLEVQTFPPKIQNDMKLILGKIFIGNVNNEFPILLLMAFSMWMRAAMMVLMGMVTKRFLQLRPLQELHNPEARAIQSICGASAEQTEALSLSREKY